MKRIEISRIIQDFDRIHGGRYRYHYDVAGSYTKNTRIIVECARHGKIEQLIRNHYRHGCKRCAMEELTLRKFYTTEQCIAKFTAKHQNRYDYRQVVYNGQDREVIIICRSHGAFSQKPLIHWRGGNCPECRIETKRQKLRKTTARFIIDARELWGDHWDYDLVDYFDGKTPVTITCRDHGDFSIPARHHLTGIGCPRCSCGRSDLEELWLDEMQIPLHQRQKRVVFPDGKYLIADGLDEENKIVFLFMGDYWHGNPAIYPSGKINPTLKKPFGEIYEQTINDIHRYQEAGYKTIVEWESNFVPITMPGGEMRLDRIRKIVPDDNSAYLILNKIVYGDHPHCPHCGDMNIWYSGKRGLYYCVRGCKKSFTSRLNTFLHGSQIALHKWLYGIYLLKETKRRITQKSLSTRIDVGREAAKVIIRTLTDRKFRSLINRIHTELKILNLT